MSVDKLLSFHGPRFPHLQNKDGHPYFTRCDVSEALSLEPGTHSAFSTQ